MQAKESLDFLGLGWRYKKTGQALARSILNKNLSRADLQLGQQFRREQGGNLFLGTGQRAATRSQRHLLAHRNGRVADHNR